MSGNPAGGNPAGGAVVQEDVDDDLHATFVRLEREIGLLLRRSRAISARLARELHPDLDGAAYGLLALLADAGPLRASDLVARLGLDKSTVSRQVASLVALGMVDREPDPADGRAQVLRPSPDGAARLARIRDVRRARWESDMSDWPADDVTTLADLLGRFNRLGEAREAQAAADPADAGEAVTTRR
ncbi:MarR family winged helix-turn-helix transcriptional regulator [Geodermatophilus nigrescens]